MHLLPAYLMHLVLITLCMLAKGTCSCTFTTTLVGTWKSSNYGMITITTTAITLEKVPFVVNGLFLPNIVFNCNVSNDATYVVESVNEFNQGKFYICVEFKEVNNNSFYFYMNSPTNTLFSNERVVFLPTGVTPELTVVCSVTPPISEFNSLVRNGSEDLASTNCINSLLGNFYYNMTTTNGVKACSGISNSLLTVCSDRQKLLFNVSLCASTTPVMFSATGTLGCLSVIQDGSTYYSGLYNYDSSINEPTTFQFTCIMVTTSSDGIVNVNAREKRCSSSQTTTTRQTGEELYAMTAYETCPFTSDSSETDVLPIILGVSFGVLFIIVPTITAYSYYKNKIKQRIQVTFKVLDKRTAKNGIAVEHPFNYPSLPVYIVAVKRSPKGMTLNQPIQATDSDDKPTVSVHARKQSKEKSPEISITSLETDKMEPTTLRLSTIDADVKHKEEPSTDNHLTPVENTEEQYHESIFNQVNV